MLPDYLRAAIAATETLIDHRIKAAPVMPLPLLKTLPNVLVLSFAEMASQMDLDRSSLLKAVDRETHDAMSFTAQVAGRLRYFVVYNQQLPMFLIQRGLARELGHIILGHDGTRPEDVRIAEAQVFAYHLLCPRPLVRAIQESGIRLTTEVLGNATGCYERCLAGMRKTPGVEVPKGFNRELRDQFKDYVENFLDYQAIVSASDESRLADFGTYMDGYEE